MKHLDKWMQRVGLWLALLIMGMPTLVRADESVGHMVAVTPPVQILRQDGGTLSATAGMTIYAGDTILTRNNGSADFVIHQLGNFRIGPDSEVAVDELSGTGSARQHSVLRLVVGYLWSQIQQVTSSKNQPVIQTPTVVIGVRGTEFDTVVSMDTETLVAVDDGSVEVSQENAQQTIGSGAMVQTNLEQNTLVAQPAIPKNRRNWQQWRKQKARQFLKRFPRIIRWMNKRFLKDIQTLKALGKKIKSAFQDMDTLAGQIQRARNQRNNRALDSANQQWRQKYAETLGLITRFRRHQNRIAVAAKLTIRMETFLRKYQDRIPKNQAATALDKLATLQNQYKSTMKKTRRLLKKMKYLLGHAGPTSVN